MAEHQNLHLSGVRKRKQAEQIHCKELQSKHDQRASQSNRGTDRRPNQEPHASDGNPNQEHHQCHKRNDVPDHEQAESTQQSIK